MKKYIIIYVIVCLITWPLLTGWFYANMQYIHPHQTIHEKKCELGNGVLIGGLAALIWPITVPVYYLSSGFAQDGWSIDWRK
jgi:uncharacterized membrane protein